MATNDDIAKAVDDYWDVNHRPVLLSALGGLIPGSVKDEISASGMTLQQYLRQNLKSRVRLLHLPVHGGGAVPLEKAKDISDEELVALVPPPFQRLALTRTPSPRFYSDIWNVFRGNSPILPVFIEIPVSSPPKIHTEKPENADIPIYDVQHSDLPLNADGQVMPVISEVTKSIRNWASRHDISLDSIREHAPSDEARDSRGKTLAGNSNLAGAFALLSADELRRIQIPADIVINLLRRL